MSSDPYIAQQYGRAYFGLHRYKEAVRAFEYQIRYDRDSVAFWWLARAHHRVGHRDQVGKVLRKGLADNPTSSTLKLSYAAHLINMRVNTDLGEAEVILLGLLKRSPDNGHVLQQLCKLLSITGRVKDAEAHLRKIGWRVQPEYYLVPIAVELHLARREWEEAETRVGTVPPDDEHLVGLKKKIYLRWAEAEQQTETRRGIAQRGLAVPMDANLNNNMPILFTSAKLARLAGDEVMYERLLREVEEADPQVAQALRDAQEASYWEDMPF
jgi:tetratricopeptide (TPR) repeat protein